MNTSISTRELAQSHARSLETPEPSKTNRFTSRELDNYSISRALESAVIESAAQHGVGIERGNGLASWQSPSEWTYTPRAETSFQKNRTGLEVEISQTINREIPLFPGIGITIPFSALSRALTPTNFTAGGAFVGTYAATPEAFVFAQSQIYRAGATVFPELGLNAQGVGSVGLPVIAASQEATWLDDTSTVSRSDVSVASRTATPRRVVFQQRVSKQLLAQTKNSDALIAILLSGPLNAAIDRAALAGTGGVQPIGILNTPKVGRVSMGVDGAAPTLAKLNSLEYSVIAGNFAPETSTYICSANVRTKAKNTPKAANTSSYLLETVAGNDWLNGHRCLTTTNMPDAGAQGAGTGLGSLVFGDFSKMILCGWGGIHLIRDPYTDSLNNREIWTIYAFVDVINARPAAFAVSTDIVTS